MNVAKSEPSIPDWVTYPEEEWVKITPDQAGFDEARFNELMANSKPRGAAFQGEIHDSNEWGTVLTRGGYLVYTWGDPDYRYNTASVGKAFTWAVLGLAVDEGLIKPDDPINKTWTGEGQLSHPYKYLDQGHHKALTWRHLVTHRGGFPITNGWSWRFAQNYNNSAPKWSKCTKDPYYDNYAHTQPGVHSHYSSGGIWRLNQALTVLWDMDLKQLLDERIFSHLGVPADRWDWLPGRFVHDKRDFYPKMPGYGDFLDAPYDINGHVVRGGGGWAVISPNDLARFGLLVATGGIWKGKRLISSEWIRSHAGGNGSLAAGDSNTYISIGKVTTAGLPSPETFNELITGPVTASQ